MRSCKLYRFPIYIFIEVHMKEKNEMSYEIDIKQNILMIQDKIDEELNKPEHEIDMNLVDEYFKQIRELDGGVYEKSDEQTARELQKIYCKAAINKKKNVLWYLNTTGKRVAAILIVIGLFFGLSFGVSAIREPIVEFFLNIKDKFTEILFNQEDTEQAPKSIETVYTLGYIPEGYELSGTYITKSQVNFTWETQNGEYINFTQYILKNISTIDVEKSNLKTIYINNTKVVYSEKCGITVYFWNTDEYAFSLSVNSAITDNEIIKIIETLIEHNC